LVLDNFEHLLDGVDLLAEISVRGGVKLLVTSRERLNLQGEWVFETQGLPVPPNNQAGCVEEYSSVALFVQSARRAQAGFELREEDRPWAVHICQMLEGMPLGIELAAAWVSVLTCREIAHEIERSLDFLATSMRDVPSRQRSLRAAFDHSWSLLSTDERRILSRLAIFQGGFRREAAEKVAGATLLSLLALASKSLVLRSESGRFDLHEIVRKYALSHLVEDPQCETARDRHCEFYLSLLRDREKDLQGSAQHEAIRELKDEINNVNGHGFGGQARKVPPISQALRSFALLFDLGGLLPQGTDLLDRVVQAIRARPQDEAGQKVLGQALTQQGDLLFRQGHFIQALNRLEESLSILRPFGDPALLVGPLIFSAAIRQLTGDFSHAQLLNEEAWLAPKRQGMVVYSVWTLFCRGRIASLLGRR
jgi:predicted ATPase